MVCDGLAAGAGTRQEPNRLERAGDWTENRLERAGDRVKSWFDDDVYSLLGAHGVALVIGHERSRWVSTPSSSPGCGAGAGIETVSSSPVSATRKRCATVRISAARGSR